MLSVSLSMLTLDTLSVSLIICWVSLNMLSVSISIIHHNHLMNADTAPGKIGGVSTLSENGYGNRRQRTVDRNVRSPTRLRLVTAID